MTSSCYVGLAFILDLLLGDPSWIPHPVRIFGKMITFLEKKLRNEEKKSRLRLRGALLALVVTSTVFLSTLFILSMAEKIGGHIKFFFSALLSYFCLATRDLYDHGIRVYERLKNGDLDGARYALSMIVSRDTKGMEESRIIRSTIESIAENTNDGVVAPLFFLFLGGPPLCMAYKAVNTLDSMVGYKNEKYVHFGFFSARLDDIFNFIPARISAIAISLSSLFYFRSFSVFLSSLKTVLKEASKHPSPNSGYPEAAMASALGVRISGPQYYGGKLSNKPYIGCDRQPISPELIKVALHIMLISSFLVMMGGMIVKGF